MCRHGNDKSAVCDKGQRYMQWQRGKIHRQTGNHSRYRGIRHGRVVAAERKRTSVHGASALKTGRYNVFLPEIQTRTERFVSPDSESVPNIVLIHCVKGGGRELNLHKTLCVYDTDRNYTNELMKIYERV